MEWTGSERTDEDELGAFPYISGVCCREGNPDEKAIPSLVLTGRESQKSGDQGKPHFRTGDRELALEIDRADFAIRIRPEDGLPAARAEWIARP